MNGLALCSGVGGLELGLRIATEGRHRVVCWVEREACAAATLVARMEEQAMDRAPVWDDITSFDGRPWRGLGFPAGWMSSEPLAMPSFQTWQQRRGLTSCNSWTQAAAWGNADTSGTEHD
jgi:hypothetical protein